MKKIYKYLLVMVLPIFFIYFSFPSGSPGGKTGSIGDGGETCHGCHTSFDVISQANWISSDIPDEGYTPGETYTITATGVHDMVVNFGFELTAENEIGEKTGTLTVTDDVRTKYTNDDQAVTHTFDGITPNGNTNTWSMEWTAPNTGSGDIIFYAAFNAGNGADGNDGDQIYTSTLNVQQSTVGTGNDLLAEQLQIYPNPASSYVILETPERSEFRIVNMIGQQMITMKNSNNSERIDISSLEQGIYFVQVMHEGNAATIRFLKN